MPTYRILLLCALVANLAACASPGNPTGSKETAKTPEEYAACVLPRWQAIAPQTTQKSISKGYRIIAPSAVASDEVLEVVEYKEGSRATFYKGSFLSGDKLRQVARDCLGDVSESK
ncbi:hypothetical protein [Pseudomonas alkylphenolica]|uniref:hypothetical protein n=1 Tax=Pseudomonas alkylphenolica TaxID=237609 RepID=UPI0018D7488E|nr:hypothetical protein [Pseudomonas alkylphenolica]MBH3426191.1 hypothetical protein [Pseudomonas alkylphenolica]